MELNTPHLDNLLSRHKVESRYELKLHVEPRLVAEAKARLAKKAAEGKLTRSDIEQELAQLSPQWSNEKLDEEDKVNILKYLEKEYRDAYLAALQG